MENSLLEKLKNKFKNKKILIIGLGLQGGGLGLAKFFCDLGAKVTVTDLKKEKELKDSLDQLKSYPIRYSLGGHREEDFLNADIIFKGPSVPWELPELKLAKKIKKPIEMELSFFASLSPAKIIGVTGTRGKSTTTYLIYNLLKKNNYSIYLGGNLPEVSTINLLKKITKKDWVVLELSSWALSGFHQKKISPHIAVFTNFYPDHLNYYDNLKNYLYDKKAIYLYQKDQDYLIANLSLKKIIQKKNNLIWFSKKDFPYKLKYLKGDHNLENAGAVIKLADLLGIERERAIQLITNFKGLPYRQEIVYQRNNLTIVNDSASTTPIATIRAIETFKDKEIILILGGNSKNLPFELLLRKLSFVKKIILLKGSFTDEIFSYLKEKFKNKTEKIVYDDLELAFKEAYHVALNFNKREKVILFSPGATSFSMFKNEFHRGEIFNQLVKKILKN